MVNWRKCFHCLLYVTDEYQFLASQKLKWQLENRPAKSTRVHRNNNALKKKCARKSQKDLDSNIVPLQFHCHLCWIRATGRTPTQQRLCASPAHASVPQPCTDGGSIDVLPRPSGPGNGLAAHIQKAVWGCDGLIPPVFHD